MLSVRQHEAVALALVMLMVMEPSPKPVSQEECVSLVPEPMGAVVLWGGVSAQALQ